MPGRIPTEEEVLRYFHECSNWGRWGQDDQLGTINYITPEKRRQAAALVKEGISVTCSRLISQDVAAGAGVPGIQYMHYMGASGERWAGKKSAGEAPQFSYDFVGMVFHGTTITHVDSLAHIFWDGQMYNGQPAEKVNTTQGATVESIDLLRDGIVTRGVLLDIARTKGDKWLQPGEGVFPEDLEEAEKACGVRVEPGDVLLVRTGALRQLNEEGPTIGRGQSGLHAASVPWLHRRQVAMLGSDTSNSHNPSGYSLVGNPVHQVGLVAMGLWLIDNANLEDLAAACERHQRWEFMLTIGPLRIVWGTGSPVNPIAIL